MSPRTVALLIALVAFLVATPVRANTGGTPDDGSPPRYPNVGALVRIVEGNAASTYEAICSGTLIAQDLFLTAAHCGDEDPRVVVTFDPDLTDGVSGGDLISGTFIPDPAFDQ